MSESRLIAHGMQTALAGLSADELAQLLFEAVEACNLDAVAAVMAAPRLAPQTTDRYGNTGLIVAAGSGHTGVVAALLADARMDPGTANRYGDTALIVAQQRAGVAGDPADDSLEVGWGPRGAALDVTDPSPADAGEPVVSVEGLVEREDLAAGVAERRVAREQ
jgi:hypothetical protein